MEAVGVAVQSAQFQQKMAIAMVKQSAESQKAIVNMLDQLVQSAAAFGRGGNVDISV